MSPYPPPGCPLIRPSLWQNHFGGGNVWKGRRYDRKTLLAAATSADPD